MLLRETATLAGLAQAVADRRPHRTGQPARVHRRGRGGGCGRAAVRAAHDRPRSVQGAQRHPRPPRRRRAAAQRRPAAQRHHASRRRRRAPRRGRVRGARQGRRHRDGRLAAAACARRWARLRARPGTRCTSGRASASPPSPSTRRTRARCCATPTSPCTRPSAGAWATPCTPRRAITTAATGSSSPARCATPWPTTSSRSTTSRWPTSAPDSCSASRPSCAGATPSAGCLRPAPSCPPSSTPTSCASSAAGCWRWRSPGRSLVPPGAPVARGGQPVGHRPARPLAGR